MLYTDNLTKLNQFLSYGYIQGFGAGYDREDGVNFIYIQTTNEPEYDELDMSLPLLIIKNPMAKDIEFANRLLKEFSESYGLPIVWNHL